ncbi:hypothetical protein ACLI4Z_05290 [Natrialbaceae archaeon A-arb3/5]
MGDGPSRRALIGSFGAVVSAGCLEAGSSDAAWSEQNDDGRNGTDEDTGANSGSDDNPEDCSIRPRERQGQADPIETTVDIEQTDDIQNRCARAASEAALDRMNERFNLELTDPRPDWIFPTAVISDGEVSSEIRVVAEKSSEISGDGSYHLCPPSEFDFDEAVETVPREVSVARRRETDADEYECVHEVWVSQYEQHLD